MRLFVAVAPPEPVLDHLQAASAPLRDSVAGLRWTDRPAWHVTLAFLGEVSAVAADRLKPRLERAARRHSGFDLSFSGAGAFPRPARANVLWCGVSGSLDSFRELAMSVAAGARRAGAPPPDAGRPFRPHLTLARCRAPTDVTPLVSALGDYAGELWRVSEIFLIESRLRAVPRYSVLGQWPLGPFAGVAVPKSGPPAPEISHLSGMRKGTGVSPLPF
jgi:RNA 2',3'-cyclic 3'-phosphodiesterase